MGVSERRLRENTMSFGLYILGYAILVIGLALGAYYMHIPAHWVAVGTLVLIGGDCQRGGEDKTARPFVGR